MRRCAPFESSVTVLDSTRSRGGHGSIVVQCTRELETEGVTVGIIPVRIAAEQYSKLVHHYASSVFQVVRINNILFHTAEPTSSVLGLFGIIIIIIMLIMASGTSFKFQTQSPSRQLELPCVESY